VSALRGRCKELDAELRCTRRELRHARRTEKTFGLMAHMHAGRVQATTMQLEQQQLAPQQPPQQCAPAYAPVAVVAEPNVTVLQV
jgi:hypothetical protein